MAIEEAGVYRRVRNEYERRFGLTLGPAFGFNDTFAMEIRGEDARRLASKLCRRRHPLLGNGALGSATSSWSGRMDIEGWLLPTACALQRSHA
jgi:hypothetical protein